MKEQIKQYLREHTKGEWFELTKVVSTMVLDLDLIPQWAEKNLRLPPIFSALEKEGFLIHNEMRGKQSRFRVSEI